MRVRSGGFKAVTCPIEYTPTGLFAILEPQNPSIDVSYIRKVCRLTDFEAPNLVGRDP